MSNRSGNTWFARVRRDWIPRYALKHGSIGRRDLMDVFGVSSAQASADLQSYLADHPKHLTYSLSLKTYLWTGPKTLTAQAAWSEAMAAIAN